MNHNKNNDLYIHNNYDWLLGEEKVRSRQSGFNDWDDNSWDIEEYRVDPFDLKLYNHKEFLDYYGRYLEWDFQDPRLIIRRKNINNISFDKYQIPVSSAQIEAIKINDSETFWLTSENEGTGFPRLFKVCLGDF